jgi:phage terminase large subunit
LLVQGAQKKLRILCCREVQRSISDSVHKLLADQIGLLGLQSFYTVQQATITGINGTEFIFSGLRNTVALKSYEAIDRCWCEEAAVISRTSWELLLPTIRAENSEIWVSMNPVLPSDDSYQRWVVNPPPDAQVHKINYDSNPYFPEVLRKEMEHCRATDPDLYNHVWLGCPVSMLAGAVYANELRQVDAENRITRVPYDPTRPVDTYWDLGYGDLTAIWFVQSFPFEYRMIDYLEGSAHPISWYLEQMQARGYIYGTDWLPWDIGLHATQMGSGRSIEELMRIAGRRVRIVPKLSVADGINAVRTIFPLCWFDRERTADGVQALRHYRYGEVQTSGHPTREPLHDVNSHASDALRYAAICAKPSRPVAPKPAVQRRGPSEMSGCIWT